MRLPDDKTIFVATELALSPDLPLWTVKRHRLTQILGNKLLQLFLGFDEAVREVSNLLSDHYLLIVLFVVVIAADFDNTASRFHVSLDHA